MILHVHAVHRVPSVPVEVKQLRCYFAWRLVSVNRLVYGATGPSLNVTSARTTGRVSICIFIPLVSGLVCSKYFVPCLRPAMKCCGKVRPMNNRTLLYGHLGLARDLWIGSPQMTCSFNVR